MFRDYFSRIGIVVLVICDMVFALAVTGSFLSIVLVAAILVGGVAILFLIDFLSLRAIPLSKCKSIDANRLTKNFQVIKNRFESIGGRHCPNIKLYITPSLSRNAFSLGSRIIVTRGMMQENDSIIQAILCHELGHTLHYDSIFSALLQVNILAACCIFLAAEFGTILIFSVVLFILLSAVCSKFSAMAITGIITRLIRGFCRLVLRLTLLLHRIISALFFRQQEFSADSFTVQLATSLSMKIFLEDIAQEGVVECSLIERLLSDHPDSYARINHIEKTESQSANIIQTI